MQKILKISNSLLTILLLVGCNPVEYAREPSSAFSYVDSGEGTSGPGIAEEISFRSVRIGDRFYVRSVLESVFGPDYDDDDIVSENIIENQDAFGGNCDLYEGSYTMNSSKAAYEFKDLECYGAGNAKMVMRSTTLREGWRVKTCEEIIKENDDAVDYALSKAKITDGLSPTYESINRVYQLFYPIKDVPTEVAEEFISSFSSIPDASEFWKGTLLAVCISPAWQVP